MVTFHHIFEHTEIFKFDPIMHFHPADILQSGHPDFFPLSHYSSAALIESPQVLTQTEVVPIVPVQLNPRPTTQFMHPVMFPLSHASAPYLRPSPQTVVHTDIFPNPPEQVYPTSKVEQFKHPINFPLSQTSFPTLFLSPHI